MSFVLKEITCSTIY